jgi:hypothetical protein
VIAGVAPKIVNGRLVDEAILKFRLEAIDDLLAEIRLLDLFIPVVVATCSSSSFIVIRCGPLCKLAESAHGTGDRHAAGPVLSPTRRRGRSWFWRCARQA